MTKNKTKQIFRIVFIIASLSSLAFVPWILVKAWVLPLPNTVQEQVNEAIDYGFDGMIVYVDKTGQPPAFYTAGWKDRKRKFQPIRMRYSKLAVSPNYMLLWQSLNWLVTNNCL